MSEDEKAFRYGKLWIEKRACESELALHRSSIERNLKLMRETIEACDSVLAQDASFNPLEVESFVCRLLSQEAFIADIKGLSKSRAELAQIDRDLNS